MTILDSTYACNHCGREMKHRDAKTGMWEWDGEKSIRLDIHLCENCQPLVIDFANNKIKMPKRGKHGRFAKNV